MARLLQRLAVLSTLAINVGCSMHGALDTSFGTDGITLTPAGSPGGNALAVAVQNDGKLVVAGAREDPVGDFAVLRYQPDGVLDTSFNGTGMVTTAITAGVDRAHALAIQPDGGIVVAGSSDGLGGSDVALVRYDTDGSLDSSFGSGGVVVTSLGGPEESARAVALHPDGRILVAGEAGLHPALLRYLADGAPDPSLSATGTMVLPIAGALFAVAIQPDGRIVAAGSVQTGGETHASVMRFHADGTLDPSFDGDGIAVATGLCASQSQAHALTLQADGRIVIAGWCQTAGGSDFALLRFNPDGSPDSSFGGTGYVSTHLDTYAEIYGVARQADGKLVSVGFRQGAAPEQIALARYQSDGSLDASYGEGGLVTTHVDVASNGYGAALQPDGRLVVVGTRATAAGDIEFLVARYRD